MFGLFSCFLFVLVLNGIRADTNNTALSLINLYDLSSNTLRTGFEPFYTFTNLVIDNLFLPHLSDGFLQNTNKSLIETLGEFDISTIKTEWFNDLKYASKVYPSLINFIILSIILATMLPIIGICVCSYRSCCRGKFNPFDLKYDSIKRKFYAFILFVLLVSCLFGVVILFFTNQNAFIAFKNIPKLCNTTSRQLNDFSREDIPEFFNKTNSLIEDIRNESIDIFDNSIEHALNQSLRSSNIQNFLETYDSKFAPKIEKLYNAYISLNQVSDRINSLINTNASIDVIELFNQLKKIIEPHKLLLSEKFKFLEIDNSNFKLDGLLPMLNDNLKSIKTNFHQSVNQILISLKNEASLSKTSLDNFLNMYSQKIESIQDDYYLNFSIVIYRYIYYFLLGISIFVLALFILHALGLAGMCSRRMHNNFKQTCHRGVSANFLLAGTAFYFIFGIVLIIVCICMFVIGISFRHGVCKPMLDLENDQIYKKIERMENFDLMANASRIIYECDSKNSSEIFKSIVIDSIDAKFDLAVPKLTESLKREISNINTGSIIDSLKNFKKLMENLSLNLKSDQINATIGDIESIKISNETLVSISLFLGDQLASELKSEKDNLNEFVNLLKDEETKIILNELILSLQNILTEFEKESSKESLKNSILETIDSYTKPKVNKLKVDKTEEIANALPSCKILSNIYQSITLNVCYEFTDNFNTYWLILYILSIVFFIICCFSMKQADLFRKYYRYDELLDDEMNNDKDSSQYEMFNRQKSGSRGNSGAIDAFEMKGGYNYNNNMKYPSANRSAPSRNTRA